MTEAPNYAVPMTESGWHLELLNPEASAKCGCGWKGTWRECLVVDDEESLWCPSCRKQIKE